MLVKDVMKKNPVTIASGSSVVEAKELMKKHGVNKLPVLDKNGMMVGILTKNDLVKASPSDATTLDMFEVSYLLSRLTVDKVMVKKVTTVSETETVEEAARLMDDYGIGCLPVLKDKLLVGIVTESDLFKAFIFMFGTRHAGVRATFLMPDEPGVLSRFAEVLAEKKGNIVSFVTSDMEDNTRRKVTVRVTGISKAELEKIIADSGYALEDIRSV
ncbi:MAG: CBS domain-containing protein [Treponema sp.]|nr:CBS domain-containing protein [Treponema sp.]